MPRENEGSEGALDRGTRGSKLSTEVTTSPGQLGPNASDMETDTVLKKEDVTDTISQTDAVEEETNTEAIDKIKMGSNKICIRNDIAKKNMMFSPESCQAIMDMGNAHLIELKKNGVQCPSCLHYVFEGTIVCSCGKHIRSNQRLDILKTHCFRASRPNSRAYKHGYQLSQQHHDEAVDAMRAATKKRGRTFTNIWDRGHNDCQQRKSDIATGWNDEFSSTSRPHRAD